MTSLGFIQSKADSWLFVYHHHGETAYLLLYVDDMILSASTRRLVQHVIARLHDAFAVKDMGPVHHFLGIGDGTAPASSSLKDSMLKISSSVQE